MTYITLSSYKTRTPLFAGTYANITACLEAAIEQSINLNHIDLRHQNLSNGNFDGAYMPYADLTGANLSGANLSEAILNGGIFTNTDLYNTCLCYSDLQNCDFTSSNFGGTDICGANIDGSKFSTLSSLDLDFFSTGSMQGCCYVNDPLESCDMSCHPVVIKGLLSTPIVIFDNMIKISGSLFPKDIFPFLIQALEQQTIAHIPPPYTKEQIVKIDTAP